MRLEFGGLLSSDRYTASASVRIHRSRHASTGVRSNLRALRRVESTRCHANCRRGRCRAWRPVICQRALYCFQLVNRAGLDRPDARAVRRDVRRHSSHARHTAGWDGYWGKRNLLRVAGRYVPGVLRLARRDVLTDSPRHRERNRPGLQFRVEKSCRSLTNLSSEARGFPTAIISAEPAAASPSPALTSPCGQAPRSGPSS